MKWIILSLGLALIMIVGTASAMISDNMIKNGNFSTQTDWFNISTGDTTWDYCCGATKTVLLWNWENNHLGKWEACGQDFSIIANRTYQIEFDAAKYPASPLDGEILFKVEIGGNQSQQYDLGDINYIVDGYTRIKVNLTAEDIGSFKFWGYMPSGSYTYLYIDNAAIYELDWTPRKLLFQYKSDDFTEGQTNTLRFDMKSSHFTIGSNNEWILKFLISSIWRALMS